MYIGMRLDMVSVQKDKTKDLENAFANHAIDFWYIAKPYLLEDETIVFVDKIGHILLSIKGNEVYKSDKLYEFSMLDDWVTDSIIDDICNMYKSILGEINH